MLRPRESEIAQKKREAKMYIPLIVFSFFMVAGVAAVIIYTSRMERAEARKWKDLK
jgi:hypothetical protein